MAIEGLNHFNIIAPADLIERVRTFYTDVIGLSEGFRPNFDFEGYWLYAGEAPILHLMVENADHPSNAAVHTGHLDHIALTANDLTSTEARFTESGVEYNKKVVPGFNIVQLFVHDPIGLGVELNFSQA